jgi:hypothetical protein
MRGFERGTLRVRTLTEEVGAFRYYDGVHAKMGGRWSTPEWIASPADRISNLALPNNAAVQAASVRLVPGATVFEGVVAPQLKYGSQLTGGAFQYYQAAGPRAIITPIP